MTISKEVKYKEFIVGKVKDRNGNEYNVLFFKYSSDFPGCHIITHDRMRSDHLVVDDKESVRITEEIWKNIGIRMGWKKPKRVTTE